MPRLVVNAGSPDAWEIELRPGANSLGRSEENDFPIEHSTVSSSHCQIIVTGRDALIQDLGSTNGTFLEGQLVEQAVLRPGQTFQVGSVAMRYESEAAPQPAAGAGVIPRAPPAPSPGAAFCKSHPRSAARFACPKCHYHFCELCVSTRPSGGVARKFCRACGVECTPLEARPVQAAPRAPSFASRLGSAFLYPLKGDGAVLLVTGTIFYALINAARFFARFAGLLGLVPLVFLGVFGTGYLICYLRRILTSSALGEEAMPDWPEVSEWSDIVMPFLQFVGTVVACFLPTIGVALFVAPDDPWRGSALVAAGLFGCAYFPMAFLAVSMLDSVGAVNPLLVVPSIVRIPLHYLVTVLLLAGVLAARWAGGYLLPMVLPVPIVPTLVAGLIGLYLLTVEMRILGLLYLTNKEQLGWFKG
ncbi:MAG: FHA domain-containing protein [Verrucomicrobiota bacterium]|jgi:hypothetical protein